MQMNLKLACATVVLLTLGSGAAFANHACHDDAFKFLSHCHPGSQVDSTLPAAQ
jgi:hypothetical protein